MASRSFCAWVTLVSKGAVDGLVTGLVRQGFSVGPLSGDGTLTKEGEYATLVALQLAHANVPENGPDGKPISVVVWCQNHITGHLTERKMSWHSITTVSTDGMMGFGVACSWMGPCYFVESPPKYPPKSNEPHLERMDTALGDDK